MSIVLKLMSELSVTSVYNYLCKPSSVAVSTFLWGVSQHVHIDKKTATYPLSSLGNGAITGSLYVIGGGLVASILPKELVGLVTVASITAIAYQKGTELYNAISSPTTPTE